MSTAPPDRGGLLLIVGLTPGARSAGERWLRAATVPVVTGGRSRPVATPDRAAVTGPLAALDNVARRLAATLDVSGEAPPLLDDDWPDRPDLAGLRAEAAAALAEALKAHRIVGLVDDWAWLTAPFWHRLDLPVAAVIVWSDPDQAAGELARYHGTDGAGGLALWEASARGAVSSLQGVRVAVCSEPAAAPPARAQGPHEPGQVAPSEAHRQLTSLLRSLSGTHDPLGHVELPPSSGWGPALLGARRQARQAAAEAARASAALAPAHHEIRVTAAALRWVASRLGAASGTDLAQADGGQRGVDGGEGPAPPPALVDDVTWEDWLDRATFELPLRRSDGGPTVTVLLAVDGTDAGDLVATVDSVVAQTWTRWELLLCVAREDVDGRQAAERLSRHDTRIRVCHPAGPAGLPAALAEGGRSGIGEWVVAVDHGDQLVETALGEALVVATDDPRLGLVYTDEVLLDESGELLERRRKPGWSPNLLLGAAYLGRMWMIRRTLLDAIGGIPPGPAWEYDLALRAAERGERIAHLARPAYRRRVREVVPPPAAPAPLPARVWDSATTAAAAEVLRSALLRRDPAATVHAGPSAATFHLGRPLARRPSVRALIELDTDATRLQRAVDGLGPVCGIPDVAVTFLDRGGRLDPELDAVVAGLVDRPGWRRQSLSRGSWTVGRADTVGDEAELTLLVDPDLDLTVGGWLLVLVEELLRPDLGAVGPRLATLDGRLASQGLTFGPGPRVTARGGGPRPAAPGWTGVAADCLALSGCLLTWTALLHDLGLDPRVGDAWADADYCLRLASRGWRVLATPRVVLRWTRPVAEPETAREPSDEFRRRWAALFDLHEQLDPGWLPGPG